MSYLAYQLSNSVINLLYKIDQAEDLGFFYSSESEWNKPITQAQWKEISKTFTANQIFAAGPNFQFEAVSEEVKDQFNHYYWPVL